MQRWVGVKAFVASPLGRATLIALSIVTLAGSFIYLGVLLGIATFLLFSLALPIYFGWKRPRQLAVAGLVVLLIAAPLASVLAASNFRSPSPIASSSNLAPYGFGGSVLQNAKVSPYDGAPGAVYHFSVDLHPNYAPPHASRLLWVVVYVSTCPGATSSTNPFCPGPYPFVSANRTFANGSVLPSTVVLNTTLNGSNIWWWNMATAVRNNTTGVLTWIWLQTNSVYNAIQGPVSGDFLSTLAIIIPTVYQEMFLYAGLVFFVALLVYALFKSRERRRQVEREVTLGTPPSPPPSTGAARDRPSTSPGSGTGATGERRCSNCQAVIFPAEDTCWKCGQPVSNPSSPPLTSTPK